MVENQSGVPSTENRRLREAQKREHTQVADHMAQLGAAVVMKVIINGCTNHDSVESVSRQLRRKQKKNVAAADVAL